MSGENDSDLGQVIGWYFSIAFVVGIVIVVKAPVVLKVPEVGFWIRILLFILFVPAGTIGLLLGRLVRDAIVPDFVMAGSTGDLVKARLFWAIGPQSIGFAIGYALTTYLVQKLL